MEYCVIRVASKMPDLRSVEDCEERRSYYAIPTDSYDVFQSELMRMNEVLQDGETSFVITRVDNPDVEKAFLVILRDKNYEISNESNLKKIVIRSPILLARWYQRWIPERVCYVSKCLCEDLLDLLMRYGNKEVMESFNRKCSKVSKLIAGEHFSDVLYYDNEEVFDFVLNSIDEDKSNPLYYQLNMCEIMKIIVRHGRMKYIIKYVDFICSLSNDGYVDVLDVGLEESIGTRFPDVICFFFGRLSEELDDEEEVVKSIFRANENLQIESGILHILADILPPEYQQLMYVYFYENDMIDEIKLWKQLGVKCSPETLDKFNDTSDEMLSLVKENL